MKLPTGCSRIMSAEQDGETILLNLETGEYFGCNQAGSTIWRLASEGVGVAEIGRTLKENSGAPVERAESDVQAYIEKLTFEGLL